MMMSYFRHWEAKTKRNKILCTKLRTLLSSLWWLFHHHLHPLHYPLPINRVCYQYHSYETISIKYKHNVTWITFCINAAPIFHTKHAGAQSLLWGRVEDEMHYTNHELLYKAEYGDTSSTLQIQSMAFMKHNTHFLTWYPHPLCCHAWVFFYFYYVGMDVVQSACWRHI